MAEKIRLKNIPIVFETPESEMSVFVGFDFTRQKVYVVFKSTPKKMHIYSIPKWANVHAKKVIEKRVTNKKDARQIKRLTNYVSNFIVHMGFNSEPVTYV